MNSGDIVSHLPGGLDGAGTGIEPVRWFYPSDGF